MNQFDLFGDDFEGITAGVSLEHDQDLEIELLLDKIRDTRNSVVFNVGTGGSAIAPIIISSGIVYFGACDHIAYALDIKTGKEIWHFTTQEPILSSPATDGNRIFVSSYDGNLYCLDMEGREIWRYNTGSKMSASPVIDSDRVYVGNMDGVLFCLDMEGRLLWKYSTNGPIGFDVGVGCDMVFIGSFDHRLHALDRNGRLVWTFTANDILGGAVFHNDTVYVGSFDMHVYAIGIDGKLKWKFPVSERISIGTMIKPTDDKVYFPSRGNTFYAIREGQLVWKKDIGQMSVSNSVIDDRTLYFVSGNSNLYAVDPDSGREFWKFGAGAPLAYLAKEGEVICMTCYDGNVYAVNTSGELLWKFHTSMKTLAEIDFNSAIEHTVTFTDFSQPLEKKARKEKDLEVGNYSDIKGAYIQNDMRDYIGNPTDQGGVPGIKYKSGSKKYR